MRNFFATIGIILLALAIIIWVCLEYGIGLKEIIGGILGGFIVVIILKAFLDNLFDTFFNRLSLNRAKNRFNTAQKIACGKLKENAFLKFRIWLGEKFCVFPEITSEKLYRKAYNTCKSLAGNDYPNAQYFLGKIYDADIDIYNDAKEAEKWYKEATRQEHKDAQFALARMYYEGRKEYGEIIIKQSSKKASRIFNRVIEYYKEKADRKVASVDSIYNLAWMYNKGQGDKEMQESKIKAFEFYKKAAEQGHVEAQFELAIMYRDEQDYKEAKKWLTKLADQEHADAQFELAIMYRNEQGYEEARKWFTKLAKKEHAVAQYNLGVIYDEGYGVDENKVKAFEFYKKAAAHGHMKSKENLIFLYNYGGEGFGTDDFGAGVIDKDVKNVHRDQLEDEVYNHYHELAKKGDANDQYNLACLHTYGIIVYEDMALEWYKKAADQNHGDAAFRLAEMLNPNYVGVGNKDEAMECYKKAEEIFLRKAREGDKDSQYSLALVYDRSPPLGSDDEPSSKVKSYKWFYIAGKNGHKDAEEALDEMVDGYMVATYGNATSEPIGEDDIKKAIKLAEKEVKEIEERKMEIEKKRKIEIEIEKERKKMRNGIFAYDDTDKRY